MRPPPYRTPLPEPLGRARRRVLVAAWLGRSTPATIDVPGFSLMFEAGLPDPRPVLGFSPVDFVRGALDVRPRERVLVLDCGAGWLSLEAATRGAQVVSLDPDPRAATCLRRSSLVAGFGEPDVRIGPGLEPLAEQEQFDLVVWVPPLLDGPPSPKAPRLVLGDRARLTRTLKGLFPHLARGARVVFPFPDRDATPWLHDALRDIGYRFAPVRYEEAPVLGPVRVYKAWKAVHERPGEAPAGDALPGAGWVLRDR